MVTKILNQRLEVATESCDVLPDEQAGFRKGRRGAENIFVLTTLIEKCKKEGKDICLSFIDLTKVFSPIVYNPYPVIFMCIPSLTLFPYTLISIGQAYL